MMIANLLSFTILIHLLHVLMVVNVTYGLIMAAVTQLCHPAIMTCYRMMILGLINGMMACLMSLTKMWCSCLRLVIFIYPFRLVSGHGGDHYLWKPTQRTIDLKARKFIHLPAQWVNVPRYVIEDLIRHSQGAVLSNLDGFIISNGSVSLPRACIQSMFEVIDDCLSGTPYLPSDSTDNQVRGLGSMVAFWERMRNICPKANIYRCKPPFNLK